MFSSFKLLNTILKDNDTTHITLSRLEGFYDAKSRSGPFLVRSPRCRLFHPIYFLLPIFPLFLSSQCCSRSGGIVPSKFLAYHIIYTHLRTYAYPPSMYTGENLICSATKSSQSSHPIILKLSCEPVQCADFGRFLPKLAYC